MYVNLSIETNGDNEVMRVAPLAMYLAHVGSDG